MCGHRGLELNSDLQTFEVALKPLIRNNYDRIISGLYEGQRSQGGVSDERLRAYEEMNRFLSTFLERVSCGIHHGVLLFFMLFSECARYGLSDQR